MTISSIQQQLSLPQVTELEPVVPLSERLTGAVAAGFMYSDVHLDAIKTAANDPRTASNPRSLMALQELTQEYTKRMTVTAGLVNHGVKTIETLLKS